jgi:hypothetical protein
METCPSFRPEPRGGPSLADSHEQVTGLDGSSALIAVLRSKHYTGVRKKSMVLCKNLMMMCGYARKIHAETLEYSGIQVGDAHAGALACACACAR